MWRPTLLIALLALLTALPSGTGATAPAVPPAVAAHYRQQGDAASLRALLPLLVPGMPRSEVQRLLGPPAYSPTEEQDYYPTELQDEHRFTLTLVVNYHPQGSSQAGTLAWFFIDYIGE